ncbi:unnamed protein product, partial [Ectocarpus fasciculatus]
KERVSPLFLEQTLWHLKTKDVLTDDGVELYFKDINSFTEALYELPKSIESLFAKRIDLLTLLGRHGCINALYLIYIFRSLPKQWIDKFNIDQNDINYLIETGLAVRVHNTQYLLYHKQLELFFDKIDFKGQQACINQAIHVIESKNLQKTYSIAYFFLEHDLQVTPMMSLPYLVDKFQAKNIDINVALRVSDRLFSTLTNQDVTISKGEEIILFLGCCEYVKTYRSFDSALNLYKQAYSKIQDDISAYQEFGKYYFQFIHRFTNSYLALHKDFDAQQVVVASLSNINSFRFPSTKDKELLNAKLLNRLCVTYKSLDELSEAEVCVKKSIVIAEKYNDIELELKNYVDYGYLYYKDKTKNELLFDKWGTALNKFFNYLDSGYYNRVSSREVSIYFHASLIKIVEKDFDKTRYYVDKGLFHAVKKFDHFNEIKLILVKSLLNILYNTTGDSLIQARELVLEAIDKCVAYRSLRSYWVCFHLLAKINWQLGDKKRALRNYFRSLEQLERFVVDDQMESRYLYFFEDMAMHFRL